MPEGMGMTIPGMSGIGGAAVSDGRGAAAGGEGPADGRGIGAAGSDRAARRRPEGVHRSARRVHRIEKVKPCPPTRCRSQ